MKKQSASIQSLERSLKSRTLSPSKMPPMRERIVEQNFKDHKKELEMVNPKAWNPEDRMLMYLSRQREQQKERIALLEQKSRGTSYSVSR